MHEAVRSMIEEVLRPLLQADESDIELVGSEADRVVLELSGQAAFGAGSHYVRTHVIEPAIQKAAGSSVEIVFQKRVPKPPRKTSRDTSPESRPSESTPAAEPRSLDTVELPLSEELSLPDTEAPEDTQVEVRADVLSEASEDEPEIPEKGDAPRPD